MRIVIVGGGSVGLLYAARLQHMNQQVHIVTRTAEQAERLRSEGLHLHDLQGIKASIEIAATVSAHHLPQAEVYLITVKQTDLPGILPMLRSIPAASIVIAMQNGMGHGEQLSKFASDDQLYLAVNTEGARRISPVEVEHTGAGKLRIGPWKQGLAQNQRIEELLALLSGSGIQTEYVPDVERILWDKLIANALINPLTAIHDVPNGMLLQSPELVGMMRQLFAEAAVVAAKCGQKFNETTWQEIVTICRNTSRNTSSMLQDLQNGKETEIEAITGYIVQKGKEHGISTPRHETMRQVIRLKEQMKKLTQLRNFG